MNRFAYILIAVAVLFVSFAPGGVSRTYAAQASSTFSLSSTRAAMIKAALTPSGQTSGFSINGMYSCTGAPYGAVGVQGPKGAFVPVFDSASFDQQRILTYKACILDGIASSVEKSLIAKMVKNFITTLNTGNKGNPEFVTNIKQYQKEQIIIPTAKAFIKGSATNSIAPSFKYEVRSALSSYASNRINNPYRVPGCSLSTTQLNALNRGDFNAAGGWSAFLTRGTMPGCDPLKTYYIAQNNYNQAIGAALQRSTNELNWSNGFLSKVVPETVTLGDGRTVTRNHIVTPGYLVAQQASQVLGTGLRQAENANQINNMVSGIMLNIGNQMISSVNGLLGLSVSTNGIPSFLNQLVTQTQHQAQNRMVGAAANILNNSIKYEQAYNSDRSDSNTILANAGTQFTTWENTCWSGLADAAKAAMKKKVQEQVCPGLTKGETCAVPITTTETTATNVIVITAPTASSTVPVAQGIVVSGRISRVGSSIDIVVSGSGKSLTLIQPTSTPTGAWTTDPIDLSTIPDGSITVSATENLANGAGTVGPITAILTKKTTPRGIILTLPNTRPDVTITARANGFTQSVTLKTNATRSNAKLATNIVPLLATVELDIFNSNIALHLLQNMSKELTNTTSTSGKQAILSRLDNLIAKRLIHSAVDARTARGQLNAIQTATSQDLNTTNKSWKAGWCAPANWQKYTS